MHHQRAGAVALVMRTVVVFCVLTAAGGCSHNPIENTLREPLFYFDNTLPFQPNRIWRVKVRTEPYLLDDKKALVVKQFQYILRGERDRKNFEAEVTARGGDVRYLRWFESELFPLGNWEKRDGARIARFKDATLVTFTSKSAKEVPKKGRLNIEPISVPDPLFRAVEDSCRELNWDVIPMGESMGLEVNLESRERNPGADRWVRVERDLPNFFWRAWSVGQEHSISYRTAIFFKSNVSRCPLPPKIHDEFKRIRRAQPMGVDW